MIETMEKNIDGSIYSVTQLPARRAIKLKSKLIKLFGPALGQFFISASSANTSEQSKNELVKAIEVFSSTIDENQIENLFVEMLSGVRKNGVELNSAIIDLEFAGDMAALYQVLFFVVEVNFSNFFSLIGIGSLFSIPESPINQQQTLKKTFTRT